MILPPGIPEDVGMSSVGLARIDDRLAELTAARVLPGAVTIIARHGQVIHRSAVGFSNLTTGGTLSDDSIFAIYSMTKPITAAAMMILYDEGRWSPEDPIDRHLPEFVDVKGPDGAPVDHAPTLVELMTHTAGFGYGIGLGPHDAVDTAYKEAGVWAADNLAEMARRIASVPLAYQPGRRFRYSLSMDLQGAIIERLSGEALPDFMRTRIFEPLGMQDTDFFVPEAKRGRLSTVYHMYGVDELTVVTFPGFTRDGLAIPKLPSGGAGLYSTADDYARFAQMLLNKGELGGRRILMPAAVELMTSNHLSQELLAGGFIAGVHAFRPGYGYGFNGAVFYDPELAGSPVGRGTYQWDGAAGTWFWVDPENQILFVGMTQRMLQEGMPLLQAETQKLIAEASTP